MTFSSFATMVPILTTYYLYLISAVGPINLHWIENALKAIIFRYLAHQNYSQKFQLAQLIIKSHYTLQDVV